MTVTFITGFVALPRFLLKDTATTEANERCRLPVNVHNALFPFNVFLYLYSAMLGSS